MSNYNLSDIKNFIGREYGSCLEEKVSMWYRIQQAYDEILISQSYESYKALDSLLEECGYYIKDTNNITTFGDIVKTMEDTYNRKNADYGNSFDISLNKYGVIAAITRLSDKWNRLESLALKGENQVKDESIEDTLLDMANYAIMTVMWMRNKK